MGNVKRMVAGLGLKIGNGRFSMLVSRVAHRVSRAWLWISYGPTRPFEDERAHIAASEKKGRGGGGVGVCPPLPESRSPAGPVREILSQNPTTYEADIWVYRYHDLTGCVTCDAKTHLWVETTKGVVVPMCPGCLAEFPGRLVVLDPPIDQTLSEKVTCRLCGKKLQTSTPDALLFPYVCIGCVFIYGGFAVPPVGVAPADRESRSSGGPVRETVSENPPTDQPEGATPQPCEICGNSTWDRVFVGTDTHVPMCAACFLALTAGKLPAGRSIPIPDKRGWFRFECQRCGISCHSNDVKSWRGPYLCAGCAPSQDTPTRRTTFKAYLRQGSRLYKCETCSTRTMLRLFSDDETNIPMCEVCFLDVYRRVPSPSPESRSSGGPVRETVSENPPIEAPEDWTSHVAWDTGHDGRVTVRVRCRQCRQWSVVSPIPPGHIWNGLCDGCVTTTPEEECRHADIKPKISFETFVPPGFSWFMRDVKKGEETSEFQEVRPETNSKAPSVDFGSLRAENECERCGQFLVALEQHPTNPRLCHDCRRADMYQLDGKTPCARCGERWKVGLLPGTKVFICVMCERSDECQRCGEKLGEGDRGSRFCLDCRRTDDDRPYGTCRQCGKSLPPHRLNRTSLCYECRHADIPTEKYEAEATERFEKLNDCQYQVVDPFQIDPSKLKRFELSKKPGPRLCGECGQVIPPGV